MNNINDIKHISQCNGYEFIRYRDLIDDMIPNDVLKSMDNELILAMLPKHILAHFSDTYIVNEHSFTNTEIYRKIYKTMINTTFSVFVMSIMRYYRDNESMFIYKKDEDRSTDAKTAFALSLVEQKYLFLDMVNRVLRYTSTILNKVGLRQIIDNELYEHINNVIRDDIPAPDKFTVHLDDPHRQVAKYEFTTNDTDKVIEFLEDTAIIDALVFSETTHTVEYNKEYNNYNHTIRIKRNVRDKYMIHKFFREDKVLALVEV